MGHRITKENLKKLIAERAESVKGEEASPQIRDFIEEFGDIGKEIQESAPTGYVKSLKFDRYNILGASIEITQEGVTLFYRPTENIIEVLIKGSDGKETCYDILKEKDNQIYSSRESRYVTAEDCLEYFDQTDVYYKLIEPLNE